MSPEGLNPMVQNISWLAITRMSKKILSIAPFIRSLYKPLLISHKKHFPNFFQSNVSNGWNGWLSRSTRFKFSDNNR